MKPESFELFYRWARDMKESRPTSKYYQQLWVTVLDCAPNLEKVRILLKEDMKRCIKDSETFASDVSYVNECAQFITNHCEAILKIKELE